MHAPSSYDYALIRLVPSVERGECINVGVILYCPTRRFLGMRVHLDRDRALALAPDLDLSAVQQQLDTLLHISEGKPEAGQLGTMSQSERFHWLTSPRSTIIQISPVHEGISDDPQAELERLLRTMVMR
jgi:hypothetical protein